MRLDCICFHTLKRISCVPSSRRFLTVNYPLLSRKVIRHGQSHTASRGNDNKPNYLISDKKETILSNLGFEEHYKIRSNIESLIQDFSTKPLPKLSYSFLTRYKPGKLSANEEYILSIKMINLLLSYTCKQIHSIQKLPYVAILNPKVESTHSLYLKTLRSLLSLNFPYDMYDREMMINVLRQFLNDHQDTLVILSNGLTEIHKYNEYPKELIFRFLNEHLRNRISMKLLATHYIKLIEKYCEMSNDGNNSDNDNEHKEISNEIGIIHRDIPISSSIEHNFEFVTDLCNLQYDSLNIPKLKFVCGQDIKFSYVPIIFEYVITEILKNSMRSQIENGIDLPIEISIVKSYEDELTIKISDHGRGMPSDIEAQIFDYSFSSSVATKQTKKHNSPETYQEPSRDSFEEETHPGSAQMLPGEDVKNISGMGFGLPLCKIYLELFDSKIELENLYGHGTDVYVRLRGPTSDMFEA